MNPEPTDYECFGTYPQADGQTLAERDCFHCVYATGCAKITPQPKTTMTDDTIHNPLGRKFDGGKPDYTLLPWDAVEEVVKVLDYGAKKYARDNWKHVDDAETRYLAAAFRHLSAYAQGNEVDDETGLSHLAHAACCLLFLQSLTKKY